MPKFFVFSDVHGFYDEFVKALDEAGYDKNNPEHWLISCGDNFDRGDSNAEMLDFLLNSEQTILIKGNHEDMLMDALNRGFSKRNDIHNGTDKTIWQLSNDLCEFDSAYDKVSPLFNKMLNYFETDNYIFVHGWIAVSCFEDYPHLARYRTYKYNPKWRKADEKDWAEARWLNGMQLAYEGIIEENKTIVCGHFHTTWGKARYHRPAGDLKGNDYYEFGEGADFSPYYDKGIIAIDGCTAFSGRVNILVIEDEFLGRNG